MGVTLSTGLAGEASLSTLHVVFHLTQLEVTGQCLQIFIYKIVEAEIRADILAQSISCEKSCLFDRAKILIKTQRWFHISF